MNREVITGIMLTLLFMGILPSAFNIQPLKADWTWTETTYVRADGSVEPDSAPISSIDNVTYTLTDNIVGDVPEYSSVIVVERDNIVVDGAGYTVQGTGAWGSKGIDLSGRNNVTIRNMEIRAFWAGIWLDYSSNSVISGNNITNNYRGVYLYESSNNTVSRNNITNNQIGVWLNSGSSNNISRNNITNNKYEGVYLSSSSKNNISGNKITNNNNGISLSNSSSNTISGNNITNNQQYGIQLHQSSNNSLSGNNVTANNFFSILLYESFDNSISGNSITNNRYGVYIGFSSNNSLSENIMNSNRPNLFVEGDELGHFVHSIDVSNLVDEKPVYYLLGQKDLVINPATHPQVGYLGLINCANVTVEGLTLTNNGQVLLLVYTNNSRITNNRIANNYYAVELWYSSNNNISRNIITANERWSIMVRGSVNNRIFENNISANFPGGIQLGQSSNNYVSGNNITNNYMGLAIYSSYNNSISRNNITDNYFGVMLSSSSDNKFYHNNFENNTQQVYFSTPAYANFWDGGYPSGGNYWSDYEQKYPNAKEIDDSGIWNTPYVIDENNQDKYPLVEPWSPKPSSPVEATQELIETIETWNLRKGTENSLKAKLKVAIHMLDLGKEDGAIRKLTAFINRVEMLKEKTLTNEQADELVLEAQRIIDLIKVKDQMPLQTASVQEIYNNPEKFYGHYVYVQGYILKNTVLSGYAYYLKELNSDLDTFERVPLVMAEGTFTDEFDTTYVRYETKRNLDNIWVEQINDVNVGIIGVVRYRFVPDDLEFRLVIDEIEVL